MKRTAPDEAGVRAALLTNILTPYRVPVYRALARMPGWSWRVFTNASSEFDRSWRVDAEDLDVEAVFSLRLLRPTRFGDRSLDPPGAGQRVTTYLPLGLWRALRRHRPDVVVSAELGPRTLFAWLYCRLNRVPLVVWSYHSRASAAANPGMTRDPSSARSVLAHALRRWLLARAAAVVGMGRQARAVLGGLGVDDEHIFDAPNAHDSDALEAALALPAPVELRADLRARGCRAKIALVVGRLIPAKGIEPLLAAWDTLPASLRADWSLLFVGDGPLEGLLDRRAAARERGEILRVPAVQPEEVFAYYRLAELLVFASLGDPWGLVVNEALACGVPVLCSLHAGCSDDLVEPGRNGWIFDPLDARTSARALRDALTDPGRAGMRAAARAAVLRIGPDGMAGGIAAAARSALGSRAMRARSGSLAPGTRPFR